MKNDDRKAANTAVALYHLRVLALTCAAFGIAAGCAVVFRASDAATAGDVLQSVFYVLVAVLTAESFLLPARRRSYWLALWRENAADAIGRGAGVGIGASLVGSLFFLGFAVLIPHYAEPFEAEGLARHLFYEVITKIEFMILAGLAAGASLLALARLLKTADAEGLARR